MASSNNWQTVERMYEEQHGHCYLCDEELKPGETATMDHVVPTSRGGKRTINNVRWACRRCNNMKTDMLIEELYAICERLLSHHQH